MDQSVQRLSYGLGRKMLVSGKQKKCFSLPRPDHLWGSAGLLFKGFHRPLTGIKRPGRDADLKLWSRDADHLHSSGIDVRNECSYISAYLVYLHGVNRHKFIHACTKFRKIFACIEADTKIGRFGIDLVGTNTRLNAGKPRDPVWIRGGKEDIFLCLLYKWFRAHAPSHPVGT